MTTDTNKEPTPSGDANDAIRDRRGRRLELSCRMFFFGQDEFEGEATLVDLSTSGCKASSAIELQAGMLLKVSLFLPDHRWPLRVEEAIVRWVDGEAFGLEFTSIRLAQRERLRALIMNSRV
jgi:hypothetical protein